MRTYSAMYRDDWTPSALMPYECWDLFMQHRYFAQSWCSSYVRYWEAKLYVNIRPCRKPTVLMFPFVYQVLIRTGACWPTTDQVKVLEVALCSYSFMPQRWVFWGSAAWHSYRDAERNMWTMTEYANSSRLNNELDQSWSLSANFMCISNSSMGDQHESPPQRSTDSYNELYPQHHQNVAWEGY